jgi:hypothetical protein
MTSTVRELPTFTNPTMHGAWQEVCNRAKFYGRNTHEVYSYWKKLYDKEAGDLLYLFDSEGLAIAHKSPIGICIYEKPVMCEGRFKKSLFFYCPINPANIGEFIPEYFKA